MVSKNDYIALFENAYTKEIEAEKYAAQLAKALKDNGINLRMSKEIVVDEKKHQAIVKQIIDILKNL